MAFQQSEKKGIYIGVYILVTLVKPTFSTSSYASFITTLHLLYLRKVMYRSEHRLVHYYNKFKCLNGKMENYGYQDRLIPSSSYP